MSDRVILVRHGATEANHTEWFAWSDELPLSDVGLEQAFALGPQVAELFSPKLIVSSTLLRARQTAAIIGDACGLKIEVVPGIEERNFGCLRGQPYAHLGKLALQDSAYDSKKAWQWAPPDGESLDQVRIRAVAALDPLCASHRGDAVVVAHGAVIQSICAHITGEWSEAFVPGNCQFIVIAHRGSLNPSSARLQQIACCNVA